MWRYVKIIEDIWKLSKLSACTDYGYGGYGWMTDDEFHVVPRLELEQLHASGSSGSKTQASPDLQTPGTPTTQGTHRQLWARPHSLKGFFQCFHKPTTKTESIYVHGKLWRLDRPLKLHWSSCHDMYWLYFGFWSFAWFPHVVPSNLAHSSWFRFQATCQSPPVRQRTIERSFNRDKKLTKRKLKKTDPVPCSISNPIRWILHFHHTKAQQLWSLVL